MVQKIGRGGETGEIKKFNGIQIWKVGGRKREKSDQFRGWCGGKVLSEGEGKFIAQ